MDISFYGRFSSDHQRETSIEDQRRVVERWAIAHGHTIVTEFTDYATSGASFKVLKGLRRAVDAAGTRPAPFAALVVDQLARLSRDIGDTDVLVKRLKFYGIRIIAVKDGIDTADKNTTAPGEMWATDGTKVFTLDEGWVWPS
jgi:site-specific DNA recombinase